MTAGTPVERMRRLRELFDGAMDQPAEQRSAWLARETEGDDSLRVEVESLITISESTDVGIERASAFVRSASGVALDGQRLGPYQIVRCIGLGGMGAVYEAVRADDQYRQRVAIKVVQHGLGSDLSVQRFRRERQILATLSHPNIATLLDGGVAPDGRPFLVMEYVEGSPITSWCDERRLGIRERLALFGQICAAVAHAHKNLVVHRDIKPGNILVTPNGMVKLLDFGIATLVEGNSDVDMPATRAEVRAFTPEYASPEQISGGTLSTASDIYSLGVVLFELLVGRRPYDARTVVEVERAMAAGDPPAPSRVVTDDAARDRGEVNASRLAKELHGDLDVIVETALRKDLDRRYSSVDALTADLDRHRTGFPISAHRASTGYRVSKFVARHRGVVGASAIAFSAVIIGAVVAIMQAREARVERDRARFEEHRASEVASFLQGILGAGDPTWSSPTRIASAKATVAQVLDSAALRLPKQLPDEPVIRASLHRTIAKAYLSQSRLAEAGAQLDSALSIHRRVFGADNGEVATDLYFHAPTAVSGGLDSVEQAIVRAIAMMRRNHPDTIESYVPALHDLAYIKSARGQLNAAESLFTSVIDAERARPNPRQALLAITYGSLGLTYWNEGKSAPGIEDMKHGIALFDSLEAPSPVELSNALPTLATALVSSGRATEALPYLQRAKAVTTQVYGPNAPGLVQIGVSLGDAYLAQGDTTRSDQEALAGITLGERLPPGNEAERFQAEWTYARSLRKQHRFADAERFGRRQYVLAQRSVKEVPYFWADATFLLGAILFDSGKAKEGEPYLLESYRVAHDELGPQHVRTLHVLPVLVTTYDALGRPTEVERYRALMPDSMRTRVDSVRAARPARP